jgi:putative sterol carrier protein
MFFDDLARHGRVPQLAGLTGTIRLELEHDRKVERWLVTCNQGDVSVARGTGAADCVIRARRDVFAELASGRLNALSAFLRGVVGVEGDPTVLVLFQRVFPGPSHQREHRDD